MLKRIWYKRGTNPVKMWIGNERPVTDPPANEIILVPLTLE